MTMIDLCRIKEDFSVLVKEAQPWTLTQFVMWLDLKLSEFKIKGYMVLDHHTKTKPKWIAEEDTTSDVAPIPATCRQCNKPTNDGTFYTDLHASPGSHKTVSRESNLQQMDESESVRGEVGIIDLSHAENGRRNNSTRIRHQDTEMLRPKNYPSSSIRDKSSSAIVDRDKLRQETVIEIDPSSPTEKMFITSVNANKTSTPVVPVSPRPSQKSKNRPPPPLSLGSAIYTSSSSTTTPTFSSSYISSIPRISATSLSNRKYALGAPPLPVSISSSLDEMIAQAAQFNEINNQSLTDLTKRNQSQIKIDTQQQPSNQEVEQQPVQTGFDEHQPVQTSFAMQQHPLKTSLSEQNIYSQTSTSSSAVPVALHANIDNISRDISQSSTHSSTDTLEIKIESEVDNSIGDSFFMGSFDETGSPDVNDGLPPFERDYSSYNASNTILQKYGKEIELPTFEDPLVRRALEDVKPPSRHTWSKIITRCAYHLLSKGVPRKHDYQMFAESFYRRYPCVGTSRGPNPWSGLAHSISASIRNLRWNARKRVKAGQYQNFSSPS